MLMANKEQTLSKHLLSIASVSEKIIDRLGINDEDTLKTLKKLAFLSGLFHDIGKVDPVFQEFLNDKSTTNYNPNGVHIENKKFSFENHPRHNEISWFIMEGLLNSDSFKLCKKNKLNPREKRTLNNAILWHHASPVRKEEFNSVNIKNGIKLNKIQFENNLILLLNELNESFSYEKNEKLFEKIDVNINDFFEMDKKELSRYKCFFSSTDSTDLDDVSNAIRNESILSLLKSVLITADRYVSASGCVIDEDKIIEQIFEENNYSFLVEEIEKMENNFFPNTERSKIQSDASIDLSKIVDNGQIAILNAPAGSGKTKVSLQWLKNNNAKKAFYIVPRTIIAEEIYDELKNVYLRKNVSFEILTGDKQIKWDGKKEIEMIDSNDFYKSDIVITTIDQIIKSTTSHNNISILQSVIMSHVIFDEYHEYYKMSGLDLLFAEIIRIKSFLNKTKTLIMSATPNYFMLEEFLNIFNRHSSQNNIVSFETINVKDFNLKYHLYDEENALYSGQSLFKESGIYDYVTNKNLSENSLFLNPFLKVWDDKKTIVISNTATMAQKSYFLNHEKEDSILAHSKFKQEDKNNILSIIKNNFKDLKNGENILRAGPIVQASLNITSERLVSDLTSPENTLQRLGRCNRFAENIIAEMFLAIPESVLNYLETGDIKNKKGKVLSLFKKNNEEESNILWLQFLMERIPMKENGCNFKLKDIYSVYEDFYKKENVVNALKKELISSLDGSLKNIEKNIINPIEIIGMGKKSKSKQETKKMSKKSLRGKSYNTKMAVYKLENGELELTENYADNISLSRQLILLYKENYKFVKETVKSYECLYHPNDLNKDVLRTLKLAKKEKSDKYNNYVLDKARSEDFNIYTSFSKKEMKMFNKERNDEEAYIYVKTNKQNVGYIKLKQLIK